MIPRQRVRATVFLACLPADVEQSQTMSDSVYDSTVAACDPKPHPDPDAFLSLQMFACQRTA